MDTKRCACCGEVKAASEYYRVGRADATLRPYCKPCHKAKRHANYVKAGGRDVPYAVLLQREYGITLAGYNAKLDQQAHRCAVCRRPEQAARLRDGSLRRLAVDHDHVTGRLRGLLCHRCNILVWAFEENHTTLEAIRGYLDDFRASFVASGDAR